MARPTLSLRNRIMAIVAALTGLTVGAALMALWLALEVSALLKSMLDEDLAAVTAAEELNTALVMQKGYLTYFFQDRNPAWLTELDQRVRDFKTWLAAAKARANSPEERELLNRIEIEFIKLSLMRDQVIEDYKNGRQAEGFKRHQAARQEYLRIREMTQTYKASHRQRLGQSRAAVLARVGVLQAASLVVMPLSVLLGGLLAFLLLSQVLEPIRRLAQETELGQDGEPPLDEVRALKEGVHQLMEDVGQTRSLLEVSREHLIQASRLASVGKLAAGVAHSIRNPLTSVNMRLFSLERSLKLSAEQQEDFQVIAAEIRHIETIVRNFLEFSRRPKLKVAKVSPSEVVDLALELLKHRLESYDVAVTLHRHRPLPEMEVDPEQLKEVLVNLVINACEAISAERSPGQARPGRIVIAERPGVLPPLGPAAVIRVTDNGPGVPAGLKEKIFQPFFTTKDEGTGLGLSIALRIIEEHGGTLRLEDIPEAGASFVISLPVGEGGPGNGRAAGEDSSGQDPDR